MLTLRLTPAISSSIFNYDFVVFSYISAEGCQILVIHIINYVYIHSTYLEMLPLRMKPADKRPVIYLVLTGILKHQLLLSLSKYDRPIWMPYSQTRSLICTDSIDISASKVLVCRLPYIKAFLQSTTHHHSCTCCYPATSVKSTYRVAVRVITLPQV